VQPSFAKSPPALVERFHAVAARHPDGERRTMFGYPALFVGGNMATGLYEDRWVVRLLEDDLAALLAVPGAAPFSPMPGRSMKGWGSLPPDVMDDDAALDHWVERSFAFARSLPAKR
jgi:TfoX/Sxy family transcriptional regulator of competence genes